MKYVLVTVGTTQFVDLVKTGFPIWEIFLGNANSSSGAI